MTKRVVVMQGVPGSGKSTYVRSAFPGARVCSADHFFVGDDGVYRFDRTKLPQAHAECLRNFVEALQRGEPLVVVDNTTTTLVEAAPYMALAPAYGYSAEIHRLDVDLVTAAARNVHDVPADTIRALGARLANFEPQRAELVRWWDVQFVDAGWMPSAKQRGQ